MKIETVKAPITESEKKLLDIISKSADMISSSFFSLSVMGVKRSCLISYPNLLIELRPSHISGKGSLQ